MQLIAGYSRAKRRWQHELSAPCAFTVAFLMTMSLACADVSRLQALQKDLAARFATAPPGVLLHNRSQLVVSFEDSIFRSMPDSARSHHASDVARFIAGRDEPGPDLALMSSMLVSRSQPVRPPGLLTPRIHSRRQIYAQSVSSEAERGGVLSLPGEGTDT